MERIASFCVDHTKLDRGMYLSRQDGDVLTWDIRMKKPNQGDYLSTAAAHTLEHLFATYARNSAFQDGVIYVGPMGCRTGFYLLTRGLTPAQALELTVESFRFMAAFEGAVPGASEVECGNYRDMDLPAAKAEAAANEEIVSDLRAAAVAPLAAAVTEASKSNGSVMKIQAEDIRLGQNRRERIVKPLQRRIVAREAILAVDVLPLLGDGNGGEALVA